MIGTQWTATETKDNALATASKTAPSEGKSHYVTGLSASFSAAAAGKQLQLKAGTTVLGTWYVHDALDVAFPAPIVIPGSQAVSAELEASGTGGTVGAVVLMGRTD